MKKYILCSFLSIGSILYAQTKQVGIDTPAPKALFHVDGGKDNPKNPATAPTSAQIANDVVVTTDGNVGAGVLSPATKLDILSSTPGALKIVDGTQKEGRVLMTDKDGLAWWKELHSLKAVQVGVYPNPVYDVIGNGTSTSMGATKSTQVYIRLTPGKWLVNAGLQIRSQEPKGNRYWMHAHLSTSQSSVVQDGFVHLGPAGSVTTYAGLVFGNPNTTSSVTNSYAHDGSNMLSGSSLIEVSKNVTIYLLLDDANAMAVEEEEKVGRYIHTTGAWENYFYAIPIQ